MKQYGVEDEERGLVDESELDGLSQGIVGTVREIRRKEDLLEMHDVTPWFGKKE
jgi:hypothetical protein